MQPTQQQQHLQNQAMMAGQAVSTTQFVRPAWQGKFALFQATRPGKVQWSGRVSIPQQDVQAAIAYLQQAVPNQRGEVELWMTGFNNQAKSGLQYIGGFVSPQDPARGPAVNLANGGLVQQAYQGQQQAMANPQQHVYGQPAPGQQPQPTPQWTEPGATVPQGSYPGGATDNSGQYVPF